MAPITFERSGVVYEVVILETDTDTYRHCDPEDLHAAIESLPAAQSEPIACMLWPAAERRAETAERRLREVEARAADVRHSDDACGLVYWINGDNPKAAWRARGVRVADSLPRPETKTVTEPEGSLLQRELARNGIIVRWYNPDGADVALGRDDGRLALAAVERACIERGRQEWRAVIDALQRMRSEERYALREQLAAKDREIAEMTQRLEHENQLAGENNNIIADLQNRAEGADREIAQLREELEDANLSESNELAELRRQLYDKDVELAEMRAQLETKEVELDAAKEKLESRSDYDWWKNYGERAQVQVASLFKLVDSLRQGIDPESDAQYNARQGRRQPTPVEGNALQGYASTGPTSAMGVYAQTVIEPKHPINEPERSGLKRNNGYVCEPDCESPRCPARHQTSGPAAENTISRTEADSTCATGSAVGSGLPGGGGPADALRDEVRGWLGDVKPSERMNALKAELSKRSRTLDWEDRFDALRELLDEIWTRAQGSK